MKSVRALIISVGMSVSTRACAAAWGVSFKTAQKVVSEELRQGIIARIRPGRDRRFTEYI